MLVFFDLETGGLEDKHPNIQLAAIAVDDQFNELGVMETKIAFREEEAEPEALKVNHYDPAAWAGAPEEYAVAKRFSVFIDTFRSITLVSKRTGKPYTVCQLAGHNVAQFDNPRLQQMFKRHGLFLAAHPIPLDTVQLAKWRYYKLGRQLESYKLGPLCEIAGIPSDGAHDALADVRMNVKLAKFLLYGKGVN